MRDSEFARQLKNHAVSYSWGRATIVSDHPDKVLTSAAKTETHLAPKLRQVVDATKRELFLVSPSCRLFLSMRPRLNTSR